MVIPFVKMHGAANDFVVIDHRRPWLPTDLEGLVRRLCDRRRGVGADGVLLLETARDADAAMRYFNADGGAADYCGNGARCLARLAIDLGLGRGGHVRLRTAVGLQEARLEGEAIALHFGPVAEASAPFGLEACGRTFTGRAVVAGVPHFVVPTGGLGEAPVATWGAALRRDERFAPAGTNVDFVEPEQPGVVAMRTFERGVEAETLACGSGAIASAVWAAAEGHASPVRIRTAGGDELYVALARRDAGWDATLVGPAEVAYRGEWREREAALEHPARGGA